MKEIKNELICMLYNIKDQVSRVNAFVEHNNILPNDPTRVLDLSCMIDEIIGEIIASEKLEGK